MAKIVFGAGTSHTPMMLASDETLQRFVETDRNIKHRDKEGRPVTYGDLLEKADPKLADMVAPKNLVARQNVARGRRSARDARCGQCSAPRILLPALGTPVVNDTSPKWGARGAGVTLDQRTSTSDIL